ncbi:MAG: hypothetical protein CVU91_05990 [Firmicutes bacterium HGW-Firmicutes-16]|nr:MAG: hypothetical protein CVU91_05990 [Firmicutes bacterium HGW-Firmicutes-16]
MKKFGKMAFVSSLALAVVTTCTAAPMAMGLTGGSSYETAAEKYAQSIEALVETTGDAYENVTEAYPDSAINNPNAPSQYLATVVKLGNNYFAKTMSLTNNFLKGMR